MTVPSDGTRYPAPGDDVPGAPPPLEGAPAGNDAAEGAAQSLPDPTSGPHTHRPGPASDAAGDALPVPVRHSPRRARRIVGAALIAAALLVALVRRRGAAARADRSSRPPTPLARHRMTGYIIR